MKTIKHLLFIVAVSLLFATTSCMEDFNIRGNGISATDGRPASNFTKITSSGSFDVHITKGDQYEVIVNAESNILQYIDTRVSGNTLHIDIRGVHNIRNRLPMEVYVTTPYMESVKQSGSGLITTDYFDPENFEVVISGSGVISTAVETNQINATISGSGKLNITGEANRVDYTVSGSGRIDSYELTTDDCYAKISGSGSIYVNAIDFIRASISGSGNVYYYGEPALETHISGSGKVVQVN
ncbi:MAG: head GIN domain-containing protein [Draconibacterium sp.]|jgi:hypothetical protein